jgi:adenylate cyclase
MDSRRLGRIMQTFWTPRERPAVPESFRHTMMQEILRTERLRVIALLTTGALLGFLLIVLDRVAPSTLDQIWRGRFDIRYFYMVGGPFLLFETYILIVITRHIRRKKDFPLFRRFAGALVETSIPTAALIVHINNMGAQAAFGFAAPFAYFIFIILSTLRLDFRLSAFTGLVAGVELFAVYLFHPGVPHDSGDPMLAQAFHVVRSLMLIICGVLAGAVGAQLRRQFEATTAAATARDFVTNLFGQHVSPQVVERLLTYDAEATGDTRQVAVMFVDIRGFTAAARQRTPPEVVERLNRAFAVLVEIVDRNGGIINKFLGDGFLALFGAPFDDPDAAHRSVRAAREMLAAMEEDNAGTPWPLRVGIGVHVGDVVAGNVGSPRRKEYTVIGDTVNFAARLEALNKDFGSQLLISDAVHTALGAATADAISLGQTEIRGYEYPVTVWKLA